MKIGLFNKKTEELINELTPDDWCKFFKFKNFINYSIVAFEKELEKWNQSQPDYIARIIV